MMRVDWANPKITVLDADLFLASYLTTNYDGIILESPYLYIRSFTPLTGDQETYILNWIYSLNSTPISTVVSSTTPFDSKTITVNGVAHNLYIRAVGIQQALTTGSNTIIYTIPFNWVKMNMMECINSEALDTVNMCILDTTTGTYSGYPNATLNQFGFNTNLPKDFYQRISQYDAELRLGMQIKIVYNSLSNKTIGVNFIIHEII
jgi:hypothetical protein